MAVKREKTERAVLSASDADVSPHQRILLCGPTGSGKSAQVWTLPGRKFAYVFDPNALPTYQGCPNLDYVEFLPEFGELDTSLKGFNKDSVSDRVIGGAKEPRLYEDWRDHLNDFYDEKTYEKYDWIIFDSLTFIVLAMMQRQLFINKRYGQVEDIPDLKVVGAKISDIWSRINGLPVSVMSMSHIQSYENDKTKKIETLLYLPGRARTLLPLSHSNSWATHAGDKPGTWEIQTVPERRGLQDIRTSIKGLKPYEDVTIKDFRKAGEYGIGALLARSTHGTR